MVRAASRWPEVMQGSSFWVSDADQADKDLLL